MNGVTDRRSISAGPSYFPASPPLLDRAIYVILVGALATFGTLRQYVMIDEFAPLFFGVLLLLAFTHIDTERVKQSIFSPLSVAFLLFLAYYVFRLDLDLPAQSDLDIAPRRIPLEIGALFIFYLTVIVASSLRRRSPVFFFFFWFLAITLVVNIVMCIANFQAITNKNYYAYQAITFLPILHLALLRNAKWRCIVTILLALVMLLAFESRAGFGAMVLYLLTFKAWPSVSRNRKRVLGGMLALLVVVAVLIYIYTFVLENVDISGFSKLNEAMFDKGIFGRLYIWKDLIEQINTNIYLGRCSNCNTEFFMSSIVDRNLSSHNTFLEHLFRGGIIQLVLLLYLLFRIADLCYRYKGSAYARICISYLAASVCVASAYEFIIFSVLTINYIFWLGIGLLWNGMRHDVVQQAATRAARGPVARRGASTPSPAT